MNWRERMGLITKTQNEIESDELYWEKAEVHEGRDVGMIKGTTLATYNIQVLTYEAWKDPTKPHVHRETEADKRMLADLPAMLEQLEEALEALLPEDYRVRITEWNK